MAKKVWIVFLFVFSVGIYGYWSGWLFPAKPALTIMPAPPAVFTPPEPDPSSKQPPLPSIKQSSATDYKWLVTNQNGRLRDKLLNIPIAGTPESTPVKAKPLRAQYSQMLLYTYQPPLIKNALTASYKCMVFPKSKNCRGRALHKTVRADYVVDKNRINRIIYDVPSREQISDTIIWLDLFNKPRVQYMYTQNYLPSKDCCSSVRWSFDREGNIEKIELTDEKNRFGTVKYNTDGSILHDTTPPGGPVPKQYKNRPRTYCDIQPMDTEICAYK